MNDLVKFGGGSLPANSEDLARGLANVTQTLSTAGGGSMLLRLLKSGRYAYGQENIEPEEGVRWAINPYSLHHGFACWVDQELLGEVMVPFNSPMPNQAELADYGGDWNQQVSMNLMCLEGEDKGTQVLFKGTSNGLRNAVKKLIDALLSQLQTDPANIVPVIELEVDSYQHKKYGEIFFPVLAIIDWVSMDSGDLPEVDDGDDDEEEADTQAVADEMEGKSKKPARRGAKKADEAGEKPARRRRGAAAKDEAEDKPTRRRRRSA